MKSNPEPETITEMLKKLENEPVVKPFSCLNVLAALFSIFLILFVIFIIFFIHSFTSATTPKQADIDRANESIQRINGQMDEFEATLRPLREQIEALDHRVPKSEMQVDQTGQNNENND